MGVKHGCEVLVVRGAPFFWMATMNRVFFRRPYKFTSLLNKTRLRKAISKTSVVQLGWKNWPRVNYGLQIPNCVAFLKITTFSVQTTIFYALDSFLFWLVLMSHIWDSNSLRVGQFLRWAFFGQHVPLAPALQLELGQIAFLDSYIAEGKWNGARGVSMELI